MKRPSRKYFISFVHTIFFCFNSSSRKRNNKELINYIYKIKPCIKIFLNFIVTKMALHYLLLMSIVLLYVS